jgi:hypothetical protein
MQAQEKKFELFDMHKTEDQMTFKSQWGLSAQNSIKRASIAAGMADTQKQMRHLSRATS